VKDKSVVSYNLFTIYIIIKTSDYSQVYTAMPTDLHKKNIRTLKMKCLKKMIWLI